MVAPNEKGEWVEYQDKDSMERALLKAYEVTLTQAKNTPCMKSPLQDQLGSCGENLGAHMILEGKEYNMEDTDEATREVLKYIQLKEGTKLIYTSTANLSTGKPIRLGKG